MSYHSVGSADIVQVARAAGMGVKAWGADTYAAMADKYVAQQRARAAAVIGPEMSVAKDSVVVGPGMQIAKASNGIPSWVLYAGLAVLALFLLRRL